MIFVFMEESSFAKERDKHKKFSQLKFVDFF